MLNNSVVNFYDNFGLVFKASEDETTIGTENLSHSTTPLLTDAESCENPCEYPRKPYITTNNGLWRRMSLGVSSLIFT